MAIPLTIAGRTPQRSAVGSANSPYFYGGGGFKPPPVQPSQVGSANSPYYYGGGGYKPGGMTDQVSKPPPGAEIPTIQLPQTQAAIPAYTPDYSSMIGGSWEVGAAESAMAAQMAAARQAFQSQLRQNFIDLGYQGDLTKESGLGDFSKYIDKDTIQKAIDNKYSAYAQVKQQEAKTNAVNDALLASSGLGLGGTTGATATDTINQAEQARYEGLRNFLSGGQSGLTGLASLKAQLAQGVLQARFAAAQRLAAMYPPTPAQPAVEPNWNDYWGSYAGGTWALPGTGGYIVPSGIPGDQGQPQPWYVQGGGTYGGQQYGAGDLSWLPGYGAGAF